MTTITIDELRERLDEVIDQLAQGGEPVAVTRDGVAVVEMNPSVPGIEAFVPATAPNPPRSEEEREAYWAALDQLAEDIGKVWPKGVTALDAVLEQRREL